MDCFPSDSDVQRFINDGFLRIDNAFPSDVAAAGLEILWRETGCNPDDARSWTQPVIRLGGYYDPPFIAAVNAPRLLLAYDRLVGAGRWERRMSLGTFPVRFPSAHDPGDTGWHIDVSFIDEGGDAGDFLAWRANVRSRGRALLMLFLFSDVGEDDAPTRLRVGSHLEVARRLAPAGDAGLTLRELAASGFAETAHCPEAFATGPAGTVYLCHPFLVHAGQMHRGARPRFMAQPPLYPAQPLELERDDGSYSPVEQAIRLALSGSALRDAAE